MLNGELAAVDYQQGLIGPPPRWVQVILAAKWMGVAPWDLGEREDEWTEWAQCLMDLEAQRAQAQTSGKGGKR